MAAVSIPAWLDASAVAVGAVSGILVARERKLDLVGYVALSMLGGLGGGLVRDIIIQQGDVYMLESPYAVPMTVIVGCLGFLFPTVLDRFPHLLEWVDIVSVGLFVAAGTDKAMVYALNPWASVLMGTLTGVGGGMLRDIFLGDTPRIFRRSNLYAICAVVGSVVYYMVILHLNVTRPWAVTLCVATVVLLRRASLRYNILSPAEVDLSPAVGREVRNVYNLAQEEGMRKSERIMRRMLRAPKDYRMVLVDDEEARRATPVEGKATPGEAHEKAPRGRSAGDKDEGRGKNRGAD